MTNTRPSFRLPRRAMVGLLFSAILACGLFVPSRGSAAWGVSARPAPRPTTFQVFAIPGIYGGGGYLETEFFCTNLDATKTIHVGIDLLDADGIVRTVGNSALAMIPGQTATFGTIDTQAFAEDKVLSIAPLFGPGAARILADSAKIMCSAVLIQNDGPPPTGLVELKVIKANTQTGD